MPKKNKAPVVDQKEELLAYLQEGETLTSVANKPSMPSLSTLHRWIREDNDYSIQIENARVQGAIFYVEKLIELTEQDVKPQDVMWIREKISTYKWLASKLLPQFSERQHITSHNKHEVVNISWKGSMSTCPKCGWEDKEAS